MVPIYGNYYYLFSNLFIFYFLWINIFKSFGIRFEHTCEHIEMWQIVHDGPVYIPPMLLMA